MKPGRPTLLTPELRDKILALVRAGAAVEVAVRSAGIGTSTHYRWRLQHPDYREAVDRARAEAEAHRVVVVTAAAPSDWREAAFVLERQYPERWRGVDRR